MIGFAACTKTFTDINTNPNQFEKATPEATMSTAVKRTSDLLCNINMNYAWTYSHLLCINGGSSRYGVGEDGFWEQSYVEILGNLNQLITAYENTPEFRKQDLGGQNLADVRVFHIGGLLRACSHEECIEIFR